MMDTDNNRQHLQVFLNYAPRDKERVQRLYELLKKQNFINPWFGLVSSEQDEANKKTREAIERAHVVIVALSKSFKESFFQPIQKIVKEQPEGAVLILPVKLEPCDIPGSLHHHVKPLLNIFEPGEDQKLIRVLQRLHGIQSIIGDTLGEYQERKFLLGQGSVGLVFEGKDKEGKPVALKIIEPSLASDPIFADHFEKEAKATQALDHPHIVKTYACDYDNQIKSYYLAMELVDHGSLQSLLDKRGSVPLYTWLDLLRQAAKGLAYAHQKNITHRNVKPQNLLVNLCKDGSYKLKVCDFGLAKLAARSTHLTKSKVMGTPAYISPEQCKSSSEVDGRSDIYSLGVTLYQATTGHLPFDVGVFVDAANHHTNPDPILPRDLNPDPILPRDLNPAIPEKVEEIILTCMAKNPEHRYQTADELVAALQGVLNDSSLDLKNVFPPPKPQEGEELPKKKSQHITVEMPEKVMLYTNQPVRIPLTITHRSTKERKLTVDIPELTCDIEGHNTIPPLPPLQKEPIHHELVITARGQQKEYTFTVEVKGDDGEVVTHDLTATVKFPPLPPWAVHIVSLLLSLALLLPIAAVVPTTDAVGGSTPMPTDDNTAASTPPQNLITTTDVPPPLTETVTDMPTNTPIVVSPPPEPSEDPPAIETPPTEKPTTEVVVEPTPIPTAVPPTAVPPTAVPPTAVPPTAVPPTAVPPTAVPPTAVPPTAVPPTAVPPTAVPPTAVPPTAVPPTAVPPTAVPPTAVPPTAVPPTAVPTQPQATGPVPNVVRMVASDAEAKVREAGFSQVRIEFTKQAGCTPYTVVSQYPVAGTQYGANEIVTINVCQGVVVPNVIGMHKDEARAMLEAQGFVTSGIKECDGNRPDGQVRATDPGPRSEVSPGSTVTIIFWKGCTPDSSKDGVTVW